MTDPAASGILAFLFFLMATCYSAVGQGGGSGYLAAMAFFSLAPETMRLTALSLNVVVSSVALWRFRRAGHFRRDLFVPLAAGSVPAAFVGGLLGLPGEIFRPMVGLVLFWAAYRLIRGRAAGDAAAKTPTLPACLGVGGGIGFLSGLIGIGGGIFLAPILVLRRWSDVKMAAGVSAAFILVNSLAALAGISFRGPAIPLYLPVWMAVVVMGGWVGAGLGARRLPPRALRTVLAVILLVAGARLLLSF